MSKLEMEERNANSRPAYYRITAKVKSANEIEQIGDMYGIGFVGDMRYAGGLTLTFSNSRSLLSVNPPYKVTNDACPRLTSYLWDVRWLTDITEEYVPAVNGDADEEE